MILDSIKRDHILQAFKYIDEAGIPTTRLSRKFHVVFEGKRYPPKYAVSIANKILTGKELPPSQFGGGDETNSFLSNLGFSIVGPDELDDVATDESEYEVPAPATACLVGTVVFIQKRKKAKTNESRAEGLRTIIEAFAREANGSGVVVFPGGWFEESGPAAASIPTMTQSMRQTLNGIERKIVVCCGIDGSPKDGQFRDQLGIAVNGNGILAVARKFYPTEDEQGVIRPAKDFSSKEEGHHRWFDAFGKRFLLCVCYDGFGIAHQGLPNPPPGCDQKVDVVCDIIHFFSKPGKPGSGDVYFAPKGLAGASLKWKVPVFGAVVYAKRTKEDGIRGWPSGVLVRLKKKSVQWLRYSDFRMTPIKRIQVEVPEGLALVDIYAI
jgi:hypothetical protein